MIYFFKFKIRLITLISQSRLIGNFRNNDKKTLYKHGLYINRYIIPTIWDSIRCGIRVRIKSKYRILIRVFKETIINEFGGWRYDWCRN